MTFNFPHWQLPHSVTYTLSTFNPIPKVHYAKALGNFLTTRLSAVNKARRVLFYLKRSFTALTLCTMFYLATNGLRYSSTPSHPIPRRRGIGKVQKLSLKFGKGLWHIPHEAALQWLRLCSFTHRWICVDLISMFKATCGLLEFPMESIFIHSTRTRLMVTSISNTDRDVIPTVVRWDV